MALLRLWRICTRCRRPAGRHLSNDRLIYGRLCVSCYNRHREVLRGKDARGNPPGLVLHGVELTVVVGGTVRRKRRRQVVSTLEVMLAEAKRAEGSLAFLCTPPPARDRCRPVPHACPHCAVQILERAGTFHCPGCGKERRGSAEAICGCGIRFPEALPLRDRRLFRCRPYPACDPAFPARVVIAFGEEVDHGC